MFVKLTRSGPNRYVQLVEAYRDEGGRPKQRTVATLGRLDQLGTDLQSVISGLQRLNSEAPAAARRAKGIGKQAKRRLPTVPWIEGFGSTGLTLEPCVLETPSTNREPRNSAGVPESRTGR